jgi:translation initiation factor eIF-2B subunit gamma
MYGIEDEDDEEFGTAEALKMLKEKLIRDCMIVSCDLICNVNVQQMANFYRISDASLVMLLSDSIEQNLELPVPGAKGKYSPG